jgi:sortase A
MNKILKRTLIIFACLLLVTGIALVLYQPVSVELGKMEAKSIIEEFDKTYKAVNNKKKNTPKPKRKGSASSAMNVDVKALKKASVKYNKSLLDNQGTVDTSDYSKAALNLGKYGVTNGVFGYISAPAINMSLPIYLGANNSLMSIGAAHMCNTSLPVNMEDTNCCIAGHTGYRGRVFFDNLRQMSVGDEIKVKNYWQTVKYTVIDTKIITDKQSEDFYIKKGKKLLTLMTCVSNNKGGFDRFLVICENKN